MKNSTPPSENGTEKKEEPKKRIRWADLKKTYEIFRFAAPYKRDFIIGMVFLMLSSATTLAFPFVIGKLVDTATGNTNWLTSDINTIALSLIGILMLQSLFSYWRVILFSRVSEFTIGDMRKVVYAKILTLPIPFFEQRRVGELVSRITSDITQLQDTLSFTLAEFFRQIATLVVGTIVIVVTTPKLSLLMLSTYPPMIIAAVVFGRYIRKLSKQTQDALADSNVIVEETFQSVNIVKAFTNEFFEITRFNKSAQTVVDVAMKSASWRAAFVSFIIFGLFGGLVLVLWYGTKLVQEANLTPDPNDGMTMGALTAFAVYTAFIAGALGGMSEVYAKIQRTIGASERLQELLNEDSESGLNMEKQPQRLLGDIRFDQVTFSYPTRKDVTVLKDVSFHIKKGERVALVGPSGAGKSTIIQLLARFHLADDNCIFIDGKESGQYSLNELRKNIGIVPQEVILFGGTIRENIAYGNPNASEAEIMLAAEKANAMEFIRLFPQGLDTVVGERGLKLSGGQKQRIAIARAILKDPAILVLDEATSSLDSASEQLVQQALEELMKGRTSIIIAHRLSTIREADKILVLNKGELIEQGTHEELMKNEAGLYRHLIHLQFTLQTSEQQM